MNSYDNSLIAMIKFRYTTFLGRCSTWVKQDHFLGSNTTIVRR